MYSSNNSKLNYDSTEDEDAYYERKYKHKYAYYEEPETPIEKFAPKDNVYDMQLQRFELFKAQDIENGNFDVTFEIDGKKLFANKFVLTTSETLISLLSDRWSTKDEPVKIQTYSYDNFYQFLCFVYSGQCKLSKDNISVLTDMAEFYGISVLSGYCDTWLSKKTHDINEKNVYEYIEIAQRYSLKDFMNKLVRFFNRNLSFYAADKMFLTLKKSVIETLSKFERKEDQDEIFFEAVYKWAEYQAKNKQGAADTSADNGGNFHVGIKTELAGILSNINFSEITLKFVLRFIVDKDFLFSAAELYNILLVSRRYSDHEEELVFKAAYEKAEKEAFEKQKSSSDEIFILTDVIKAELAPILPKVKFFKMSQKFLTDFVVAKGVMSNENGMHARDICVQIKNSDRILTGTFKDDFRFFERVEHAGYGHTRVKQKCETKQRFTNLTFNIPTAASTVKKMKGAEWFLCLEKDRVLTLKFHTKIATTDYLIAEMKSPNSNFEITPGESTSVSATRIKIF